MNTQSPAATAFPVRRTPPGKTQDFIAEETPVEIRFNEHPYAVLMATPQHLAELAVGFALSENIIRSYSRIDTVLVRAQGEGFIVDLAISGTGGERMRTLKRNMAGRTGCGLCGIERLEDLPDVAQRIRATLNCPETAIERALTDFVAHQPLRKQTGAVHGAAWVTPAGEICAVYEDIGRHNALDKLIGWGARHRIDWSKGWLLISSRASFEMVQKAANTGCGILVAVSAPTARAIRLAHAYGLTLVGFARPGQRVIYSHPHRIVTDAPPQNTQLNNFP